MFVIHLIDQARIRLQKPLIPFHRRMLAHHGFDLPVCLQRLLQIRIINPNQFRILFQQPLQRLCLNCQQLTWGNRFNANDRRLLQYYSRHSRCTALKRNTICYLSPVDIQEKASQHPPLKEKQNVPAAHPPESTSFFLLDVSAGLNLPSASLMQDR